MNSTKFGLQNWKAGICGDREMDFKNLLPAKNRDELRQWLLENHNKESECWVVAKRERSVGNGTFRENDNLWFRDRRPAMKSQS